MELRPDAAGRGRTLATLALARAGQAAAAAVLVPLLGAEPSGNPLETVGAATIRVTNPPAERPATTKLGSVTVDAQRRRISFPAVVNQRTGVVEYVIVTGYGKTHESVLRTDTEPHHIHLGLLLLNAKPPSTPLFPADLDEPVPGEPVRIEVIWQVEGKDVRRPLEDLVVTTNRWEQLSRGPWAYNGSYLSRGNFVAQAEGSIVSLQIDPSALINNPRPGRDNDDLHFVNPSTLPPAGVPVRVEIRLGEEGPAGGLTPSRQPSPAPGTGSDAASQ